MAENKKLDGSSEKGEENKEEDCSDVPSSLFQPEQHPWQKVDNQRSKAPKNERPREHERGQRGHHNIRRGGGRGRGLSQQSSAPASRPRYSDKNVERVPRDSAQTRGRPGKGEAKRHFDGRGRTPHGRGGTGDHSADRRRSWGSDPVSNGFVHNILYERNKLYVLGLHYKTTKESLWYYIERISGEEVKHVLLFKPNGKAIVTLDKIRDFRQICSEAKKKPLERVNVLIERAPMCKSIFVRGFYENTTKEQVEAYFDSIGVLEDVVFCETNEKDKRAIVYFKDKRTVEKVVKKDHRLDDVALNVEKFFPFMGTVEPVDKPTQMPRPTSSKMVENEVPHFYQEVDSDIMKFLINKANRGLQLKDLLFRERAKVGLTNKHGYVLIKYDEKGPKLGDEFEDWKSRCSTIINDFVQMFATKEIPVKEEIWTPVIEQLPVIEGIFPIYTAHVQAIDESRKLRLVCQLSDSKEFEDKLKGFLQKIERAELEKTFERKEITDISSEKLQLLQNAGIEKILKREVHADLQIKIDLKTRRLCLVTPDGDMACANTCLRQHLDEIDQNATKNPPEILEILKTKVGKRKLNEAFKEAGIECSFNVDEKNNKVLFLGNTPEDTKKGRKLAEQLLINDNLPLQERDHALFQSTKWNDLCKKMEKRLKIRHKRELTCISVFGFKKDVEEAVKKMRDFRNKKKATEGELRLDSQVLRRLFNDLYKDDIQKIEEDLSVYTVKITFEENGDLRYTGTEEGVKEVEERLYALKDKVEERVIPMLAPGMRSYLAQGRNDLITNTEREHKCVIEITEFAGSQQDEEDTDSDDCSSVGSYDEELNDDEQVLWTDEGKKLVWKEGYIEREEADVLVCSVGSNLNLSIGAIARSISKAGGTALQEELVREATHVKEGETVYTGPGNLPCRYVIYGVCCSWENAESEQLCLQILQKLLWNCFDRASELCACSIGVPLIGTGNLGFPYDVAVRIMVDTAFNYSKSHPCSPIEEFRFIVFRSEDSQQLGISAFDEKFREERSNRVRPVISCKSGTPTKRKTTLGKKTPALLDVKSKEVSIGDLTVKVVQADITNEYSDGICNVIGQELDMKVGKLSAVIAEAAGESVQDELKTKPHQLPECVVITSAGTLPTKHILHMVVTSGRKQHLQACVKNALTKADYQNMTSLSIPAVGSGGLGLTPEESAEVVFSAIHAFAAETPNSLREVRIVVFDQSVFSTFVQSRFCNEETELQLNESDEIEDHPELGEISHRHGLIVHGKQEDLDAAIIALKNGVEKLCHTEKVEKDIIARLPPRTLRHLKRKARQNDVHLEHLNGSTIELQGLATDVLKMRSEVACVIEEQMKKEHEEERAELTSKAVQWSYCDASGIFRQFDKIVNDVIETAYKSNKPSVSFPYGGSSAELNFGTMQLNIIKTGAIKEVRRRDVIPLPPDWDPQPLDERTGKEKTVHEVPLQKDSAKYHEIEKKFFQSVTEKVSIQRILRVQNPSMYRSYVMRKQSMEEKNGNHRNELQLFHGTKHENVKDINAQGFNRSFCGQQGEVYGKGVYFAKDACYSFSFSQEGSNRERCMYLASVLVGKYTSGKEGMRAPPPRDPSNREDLYDSVVNELNDPRIFVVFNDYQCYPDYIIVYNKPIST